MRLSIRGCRRRRPRNSTAAASSVAPIARAPSSAPPAGIDADLVSHAGEIGSVAHQSAGRHIITQRIGRRNPTACCQGDKLRGAGDEECIGGDEERIQALARKTGKGRIDLVDRTGVENLDLQTDGRGGFLHGLQCGFGGGRIGRIDEHGKTNSLGHQVMQ
jgi:hypothetical protein